MRTMTRRKDYSRPARRKPKDTLSQEAGVGDCGEQVLISERDPRLVQPPSLCPSCHTSLYLPENQSASVLGSSVGMVAVVQGDIQNCHEALQMRNHPGVKMLLEGGQAGLSAPCSPAGPGPGAGGLCIYLLVHVYLFTHVPTALGRTDKKTAGGGGVPVLR